jgi:hypothetical protein
MEHRRNNPKITLEPVSARRAQCSFCERTNPPDSKFCNACGAPLHLVPCPHCAAVNDSTATVCHQCNAQLPESTRDAPALPQSAADPVAQQPSGLHDLDRDAQVLATLQELRQIVARSDRAPAADEPDASTLGSQVALQARGALTTAPPAAAQAYPVSAVPASPALRVAAGGAPRRRSMVMAGTVLLAAIAVSAYYAYRPRTTIDARPAPAASGEVKERGSAAAVAGSIVDREANAIGGAPAASTPGAAVTPPVEPAVQPIESTPGSSIAAIRPGTVPPGDARLPATAPPASSLGATADQQRAGPQSRDSGPGAASAPAAAARPRATDVGPGLDLPRPRVGPCTEEVAALGLCTPERTQRRE